MNDEETGIPGTPAVTTISINSCPKCGQPMPHSALGGLCEACLVRVGLGFGAPGDEAGIQDIGSIFDDLDADDQKLPRDFGDYELLEEIGIGGMGVIYKARHLGLGRIVALKMIKAGELARREDVRRFKSEAEAAARLRHPNIVTIHDIGEEEGLPYFSMNYVGGPNLGQLVRMQPLAARRAAGYLKKIAMAVQHAHDEGLLHRDLKPGNILINADDEPQVTDFGLARAIHSDSSLTRSGAILGSPSYMAPEQAEGRTRDIDVRTDIYALGAVLYEMMTGRPPFQGESAMHTMRLVCQADPAPPRLLNPDVPRDLETICLRCLEKQKVRRYASAREVAEELGRFLEGHPIKARPVGPAGRLIRWCRRQPALAALSAALVIAVVGGMAGMIQGWNTARRKAADEQVARQAAQAGERRARLGVYNADMMLANMAALDSDRARMVELLERHDPQLNPAMEDDRSWEWFYLKGQTSSDELYVLGRHDAGIGAVALSLDAHLVASADRKGGVRMWDMEKRSMEGEHRSEGTGECQITFSPDGKWLAAAWASGMSLLWRTGVWQMPARSWYRSQSQTLGFTPDSRWLYQTGRENVKRFPVPQDGEPHGEAENLFTLPSDWWVLPVYRPGADNILLVSHKIGFWNGAEQKYIGASWKADWPDAFSTMLLPSADYSLLAGWFNDECVHVLSAEALKPLYRLRGHRGAVFSAAFSRDGTLLASGGVDQSVQIWNLNNGERIRRLTGHREAVTALSIFPDNSRVVSASLDGTLRVWSALPPPPSKGVFTRLGRQGGLSPDAHVILERDDKGDFSVTSILTSATLARFPGEGIHDTAVGLEGRLIAILHTDGKLEIQELGEIGYTPKRHTMLNPPAESDFISFPPDGGSVIFFGADGTVEYDLRTLEITRRIPWKTAERGAIESIAFSPDSTLLIAAFNDHTVSVYERAAGTEKARVTGDAGRHFGIAVSPDNRWLACSSFIGGARLWDLSREGNPLVLTTSAHETSWSVAFTPDSRRMVVGVDRGDIAFWDTASGACVMQFRNQGIPAHQMIFDPLDQALVIMSANRVTRRTISAEYQGTRSASAGNTIPEMPADK